MVTKYLMKRGSNLTIPREVQADISCILDIPLSKAPEQY